MIPKAISEISEKELLVLIEDQVPEGSTIEYKESLPNFDSEGDKIEFLKDVIAFGNAFGGDLVYGVREKSDGNKKLGIPDAIVGIEISHDDEFMRKVTSIIASGISPENFQVGLKIVTTAQGRVLVLRVPESKRKPLYVSLGSKPRWYVRGASNNVPLTYEQVREMFIGSEIFPQKARKFREDRIEEIEPAQCLFAVRKSRKLVLHIIPLSIRWGVFPKIDQFIENPSMIPRIEKHSGIARPTLEGACHAYFNRQHPIEYLGYTYVFRDGSLEFVDATILDTGNDVIHDWQLLPGIRCRVEAGMNLLQQIGISGQAMVLLTLCGVGHIQLVRSSDRPLYKTIPSSSYLPFPEIIADIGGDVEHCVETLNALIFQSFGYASLPKQGMS